jgi:hypothetical protein
MEYIYYQTVVQVRLPINGDKIGQPEIIKKFTTQMFAPKKKEKKTLSLATEDTDEVLR